MRGWICRNMVKKLTSSIRIKAANREKPTANRKQETGNRKQEQATAKREEASMQKIEAVIQPSRLDAVKDALVELGVSGMTILEARGHGRQKGHTEFYRGREYEVDLLPKVKLELIVADDMLDKVVNAISESARTGKIG